jgi:hypothetical protein
MIYETGNKDDGLAIDKSVAAVRPVLCTKVIHCIDVMHLAVLKESSRWFIPFLRIYYNNPLHLSLSAHRLDFGTKLISSPP